MFVAGSLLGQLLAPCPALAQTRPSDSGLIPVNATAVEEQGGDTDGDGVADRVVLYTLKTSDRGPTQVGVGIARGPLEDRAVFQLFGNGPGRSWYPALDSRTQGADSFSLTVGDLSGQGLAEIALTHTYAESGSRQQQRLWLFRWDGTDYREELELAGTSIQLPTLMAGSGQGIVLQRSYEAWGAMSTDPQATELYEWRGGSYRLTERTLSLPVGGKPEQAGPLAALFTYYDALSRDDTQLAYSLLSSTEQTAHSFAEFSAAASSERGLRVEEVRANELATTRPPDQANRSFDLYVRLTPTGSPPAGSSQSLGGTWHAVQEGAGGTWRLEAPRLRPVPGLREIADALPVRTAATLTTQGDLVGSGETDLAVAYSVTRSPFGPTGLAVMFPSAGGLRTLDLGGDDQIATPSFPSLFEIADVNGDGRAEIVFGGGAGAHGGALSILGWDGQQIVSLFSGGSNTPGIDLLDLDGDGQPEIVIPQSGYCGSYASSPRLVFALRWRDGAYRAATADFPNLYAGEFEDSIRQLLAYFERPDQTGGRDANSARACIEHLAATGYAFQGRAEDAYQAYQRYTELRAAGSEEPFGAIPIFVGGSGFEEDLRYLLDRAASGHLGAWANPRLAFLHDLLGNNFETRAAVASSRAAGSLKDGRTAEATSQQSVASVAADSARAEYRLALGLDPIDREAQAGLARLGQ